ncbi:MAG: cation:proton antiporter [Anaerovorax sp.]|nr:cation:proton antiporter [Anaerovorax sp.]
MESYDFLLSIAIILLVTKVFSLMSRKVHMPQVVGALVAGVILGPSVLGQITETDFLLKTSEIGVIILMFLAGLDTEVQELKKTGIASLIIAVVGVAVPLAGGYAAYQMFFQDTTDPHHFLKAVFMGVILTATSVSITVETLREMGKLSGKVGSTILGAAIIDDILGIIILSLVTSFTNPNAQPKLVFIRIGLYFVFLFFVGIFVPLIFKTLERWHGTVRRMAVYGFAFCLIMAYITEVFFGIADITGAYFAGLFLCNITKTKEYIVKKLTVISYLMFSPMFFASIGIKTDIRGLSGTILIFSIVLTLVAILTKMVGCGLGAKLCKFTNKEALGVGVGMVSRGEVALIVAQKGSEAALVDEELFPALVLMVIVTTLITPVLLGLIMKERTNIEGATG